MQVDKFYTSILDNGKLCLHVYGFDAFNKPTGDKDQLLYFEAKDADKLMIAVNEWMEALD